MGRKSILDPPMAMNIDEYYYEINWLVPSGTTVTNTQPHKLLKAPLYISSNQQLLQADLSPSVSEPLPWLSLSNNGTFESYIINYATDNDFIADYYNGSPADQDFTWGLRLVVFQEIP